VLTELAHPLIAAIAKDAPGVATGGAAVIKTVETQPGLRHLLRITRYRREGAADRGLVVTILDVSELRRAESDRRIEQT
jgi:hypothetical protein